MNTEHFEEKNKIQESLVQNKKEDNLSTSKDVKKKKQNTRLFIIGVASFVGAALLGFVIFGIIRTYVQVSTDPTTLFIAKTLRLPVLKVNGKRILYSDYANDLLAINKLMKYQKDSAGGFVLSKEEMSDQVLMRLVNNVLIKELALSYGVKADEESVKQLKEQIITQFEDPMEMEKELKDRYGWTLDQYVEKVIRPYVLETKISDKIETDEKEISKIREKAQSVLNEIKNGADFSEMAKKYGEDGTASVGGDLGWFGRGQMVPSFESAVFSMEKGTLKDDLVQTEFGYHIVFLEDKKTEESKDKDGKVVKEDQVKAKHILFMFPSLTKYLKNAEKNMNLHLYINANNPFEKEEVK